MGETFYTSSGLRGSDHLAIMLRILLLAPGSKPESISTSLCYSHSEFVAWLHVVILITEVIDV